jgi:hypothetical protein
MTRSWLFKVMVLFMAITLWVSVGWTASTYETYFTITDLQVKIIPEGGGTEHYFTEGYIDVQISGESAGDPPETLSPQHGRFPMVGSSSLFYNGDPWLQTVGGGGSYDNLNAESTINHQVAGTGNNVPEGSFGEATLIILEDLRFPYITEGDYVVQVTGNYEYRYTMTQVPEVPYPIAFIYFNRTASIYGNGLATSELLPFFETYASTSVDSGVLTGPILFTSDAIHFEEGAKSLNIQTSVYASGITATPIPGSVFLLSSGLLGLGLLGWRRKKQG